MYLFNVLIAFERKFVEIILSLNAIKLLYLKNKKENLNFLNIVNIILNSIVQYIVYY